MESDGKIKHGSLDTSSSEKSLQDENKLKFDIGGGAFLQCIEVAFALADLQTYRSLVRILVFPRIFSSG